LSNDFYNFQQALKKKDPPGDIEHAIEEFKEICRPISVKAQEINVLKKFIHEIQVWVNDLEAQKVI
jgi:hypothetical protein